MRSIFLKLFLAFWLSTLLSGGVFFLLAFNLRLGPMYDHKKHEFIGPGDRVFNQALTLYGEAAAAALERGDSGALAGPRQEQAGAAYLFAADGAPLSERVPPALAEGVRRRLQSAEDAQPWPPDVVAVRVQGPSGRVYWAAAVKQLGMPPHKKEAFFLSPPPNFWLQILVTVIVSAGVCYWVSWRITAPLRRLRAAAQGLAEGELASRVAVRGEVGGDELAELGRDFNRMAARIESLVLAHKQLVRDVSHELRSPLARLNVALGIARQQSTGSAAGALDRIELEGERLNVLIGELLTLSQLEGGAARTGGEVELAELVEEVSRDADFEARAGSREVRCTLSAKLRLKGNRELLRRALENVVRNAVRHTAEGSAVEVTLERSAGAAAVLRVRDHGPGVSEEKIAEIFRPFYRVAEARDRQSGGTGIGLAIAEKTVKLHGGSITARNAEGGGLEVEIRLPAP
ncbi:MAG TPA: ATP-binding protein [Geomonas sp.]|nr:ATP-binding protein [Geomonas sp.]